MISFFSNKKIREKEEQLRLKEIELNKREQELQNNVPLFQYETNESINLINDIINLPILVNKNLEKFLAQIFELSGYSVQPTDTFENGIDLIITKNATTWFIQVKGRTIKNNLLTYDEMIKEDIISKYVGKLQNYNNVVIIANTYFTSKAKIIAKNNNIELINLENLYTLIAKLQPELMADAYLRMDGLAKCPKCGHHKIKGKFNKPPFREFYGCEKYPNCDYKEYI